MSSDLEWFRKYRAWARDRGRRVGVSQLCRKMISSTLQRRRWLSMVVKNISLRGKGEEGAHHRLSFPGTIHHSPWMLSFALKQAAKKEPTHYMMEACTH